MQEGGEPAMLEQPHMRRILVLLGFVLPAVVALAACGSSGGSATVSAVSSAQGSPTTTSTSASTTASTATATVTATATATTSTQAAGPAPCRAAGLSLGFLGQQGGMGEGEIGFVLHNTSGSSCRTYGYPGVLFLDRAGGSLPTTPTRSTRDFFGATQEAALVIPAGGSASFRLVVTHGVASSAGCTTAYGLQVIPPNDTATLRTTIPNGAYECQTAQVSPLLPGQTAYP
jgi:Protein of unknown function (DUF4232)